MININFAPNENLDDAFLSLKLLFQPWRWFYGKELKLVNEYLFKILQISRNNYQSAYFFTGRSGLYNLLKSFNLKTGDEVLVQAFTCEAVVLPILALKLKPVYIDIETNSFSMNPIDLKKKLSKKAKVLILQHTFGITPTQRETIISLVKKNNLLLIEDIAHTIKDFKNLTEKNDLKNHFFLLSFGRSKSLSSVFGGVIIGNNQKIMEKLKKTQLKDLSYSGLVKCLLYKPIVMLIKLTYRIGVGKIIHRLAIFLNAIILEISKKEKQAQFDFFYNKKYPNALAILLINQLKKLPKINQHRFKLSIFYQNQLKKIGSDLNLKGINEPLIRFPLLVKNQDKIVNILAKKGIILGKWYNQPVAPKELPLDRVEYQKGSCPVSEKVCREIINLPTNINLKQAKKIIRELTLILNDV